MLSYMTVDCNILQTVDTPLCFIPREVVHVTNVKTQTDVPFMMRS